MDLNAIQQAKQIHDLTQQITDLTNTLNGIQAQLDALNLTQAQITAALTLYDQINQVMVG